MSVPEGWASADLYRRISLCELASVVEGHAELDSPILEISKWSSHFSLAILSKPDSPTYISGNKRVQGESSTFAFIISVQDNQAILDSDHYSQSPDHEGEST